MSTITIGTGGIVSKDPADVKVVQVDWDTDNLAVGATITTSTWTITEVAPVSAWVNTTAYVVNDKVLSGGVVYRCILAHTDFVPPNAIYWTVVVSDTPLTKDNDSTLVGGRKTQIRLLAGTVRQVYDIANKIVTSESPTQTKERSFRVLIENL